jgi:dipeptidase E
MNDKKPIYLLAGGRGSKSPDNILKAVFKDIGKASPTIAYVGGATEDDTAFFQHMSSMVRSAGDCKLVHAVISPRNADLKKATEILEKADAVYVGGGDVEAGMEVLNKKKMTGIFPELFNSGKLFFGVSAGSIMLANEWVRWRDPDDDDTAEMFPCMGLAPVICDTHGEGDHWEELQAALNLKPAGTTGYGITSGACLVVYADGKVDALGGAVARYTKDASKVRQAAELKPV